MTSTESSSATTGDRTPPMVMTVAKALLEADIASSRRDFPGASEDAIRAAGQELFLDHHIPLARAAILAMREPTGDMIYHGLIRSNGFASGGNKVCNAYRAMIDAALLQHTPQFGSPVVTPPSNEEAMVP